MKRRGDRIREKIDNQGRAKDLTIDIVSCIRNFEATKFSIRLKLILTDIKLI